MYNYGSQFWMICIAFILVIPLTSRFYLPVFMKLRLTSSYEYLSIRFNSTTRYLASGFYIMQMTLYTSVAVYAPALALSHGNSSNIIVIYQRRYTVFFVYISDRTECLHGRQSSLCRVHILRIPGRHESRHNRGYVPSGRAYRFDCTDCAFG